MDGYRTSIPSFTNERLNKILKGFYDKKLNLSSYNQYNETIRDEKKNRDIAEIVNETKKDLNGLYDAIKVEIHQIVKEIASIAYPNISKDVGLSGEKTFGAIEFQNALNIYNARPKNIQEILKLAIEHTRFDFVFLTLDLYMNDSELPAAEKHKITTIQDELYNKLGFTEKQKKKKLLERELVEVKDQIELINDSPDNFEAKIMTTIKVNRVMHQAGQIEGETIL